MYGFSSVPPPPSPPPALFGRRRIVSDSNLERGARAFLQDEDCELLLRDWQLERRQLQMENQRLTKLLDDAHKHIALLQQERKLYYNNNNDKVDSECSSHAATVKAGSSHYNKRPVSLSPSRRQKSHKMFPKLFSRNEKWDDDDDDSSSVDVVVYNSEELMQDAMTCGAVVCDERKSPRVPKAKSFSKAAKKHLEQCRDDAAMDFCSPPSSSPRAPSFAEF